MAPVIDNDSRDELSPLDQTLCNLRQQQRQLHLDLPRPSYRSVAMLPSETPPSRRALYPQS